MVLVNSTLIEVIEACCKTLCTRGTTSCITQVVIQVNYGIWVHGRKKTIFDTACLRRITRWG